MIKILKMIWKDSVWSQIIACAIIALFTAIIVFLKTYLSQVIYSSFKDFFLSQVSVPVWGIFVFVGIFVCSMSYCLLLIRNNYYRNMVSTKGISPKNLLIVDNDKCINLQSNCKFSNAINLRNSQKWGYSFNGVDQFIDVGKLTFESTQENYSVLIWAKPMQHREHHRVIFSKGPKPTEEKNPEFNSNYNNSHFEVYIEGNAEKRHDYVSPKYYHGSEFSPGEVRLYAPRLRSINENKTRIFQPGDFGSGFIVDDNWYHFIAIVKDQDYIKFYVDLEEGRTENIKSVKCNVISELFVGKQTQQTDNPMFFKGEIFKIELCKKALSISELSKKHRDILNINKNFFKEHDFKGCIKTPSHPQIKK
jgi:hypothetical protein